jgi:hypothetical protein
VAAAKLGGRRLLSLTALDVEQFITDLRTPGLTTATGNRYRDGLSVVFKRPLRDELVRVLWLDDQRRGGHSRRLAWIP